MSKSRAEPMVRHALVLVCEECSGRSPRPKAVRSAIKGAVKSAGARRALRVVGSQCLDRCPKRAVVVAVARRRGDEALTCHEVSSDAELDALIASVLAELG